jgi:hypothetical protein
MRKRLTLSLLTMGLALAAQTPTPAVPAVKFRGALWVSGAASDRQTEDGSMFLRSDDAGNGQLSVEALQLGADVTLGHGFGLKFTVLAGQWAKNINAGTFAKGSTPAETGSLAWPEAMVTWSGGDDTLKFGRMYTAMGMEVVDGTQNVTASRGLLFNYALPYAQVGFNWHHAFSPSWSADLYLYNGEDRLQDNNRGKTAGLGLTYNHAGSAEKFVTVMAFSGPEQDGLGTAANTGAEGRKRERLCLSGQWVWGKSTLQWEGESARETFPGGTFFPGATGLAQTSWSGAGAIYKYQFTEPWSAFGRVEVLKDDSGLRLSLDPSIAAAHPPTPGANLEARSLAAGVERRWHATFTRLEVRHDHLNRSVRDSGTGKLFQDATSLTWSLGTSF